MKSKFKILYSILNSRCQIPDSSANSWHILVYFFLIAIIALILFIPKAEAFLFLIKDTVATTDETPMVTAPAPISFIDSCSQTGGWLACVHNVSLWAFPDTWTFSDTDENGQSIIKTQSIITAHASLKVLGLPIGAPFLNSLFVVEPTNEDGCTQTGFGTSADYGADNNNLYCKGGRFEWPDKTLNDPIGGTDQTDWKIFYRSSSPW